jgi:hypothetical protein
VRTITESTAMLRVWLRDSNAVNAAWTDADLQTALRNSADTIFDLFLNDPRGNPLLAAVAFPQLVRAYQVDYKLPSDCKLVTAVEYRMTSDLWGILYCGATPKTTHTQWTGITSGCFGVMLDGGLWYVYGVNLSTATSMATVASLLQTALRTATGGLPTVTWDSANTRFVFTCYDEPGLLVAAPFSTGHTELSGALYLNGDAAGDATLDLSNRPDVYFGELPRSDGNRQVAPFVSGAQALYPGRSPAFDCSLRWGAARVRGYFRLDPPPIEAGAIMRVNYLRHPAFPPVARGYDLPNGFDELMEFYAAALVSHEELEDAKPMGYFGQMFRNRYNAYVRGAGDSTARVRQYVEAADSRM